MARRALVVWIDAEERHCGGCHQWGYSVDRGTYWCRIFGDFPWPHRGVPGLQRHPDCLKAETFAGG